MVKIGKKIREIRERDYLSQREFAERVQVSPTTIVKLEGGQDAQRRTVRKIAEALGMEPHQLQDEG